MRHLRQVAHNGEALDVFAQRDGQLALALREPLIRQELLEIDGLARHVRHLDAHAALARDGCDDANRHRLERHRDVVRQRHNLRQLRPRLGLKLEERDHGAGADVGHLAAHRKVVQHLLEQHGSLAEPVAIDHRTALIVVAQEGEARVLPLRLHAAELEPRLLRPLQILRPLPVLLRIRLHNHGADLGHIERHAHGRLLRHLHRGHFGLHPLRRRLTDSTRNAGLHCRSDGNLAGRHRRPMLRLSHEPLLRRSRVGLF